MKKMTILFFIGIILTSCSNEADNLNRNNNLNIGEYVLLIPLSSPINTIEYNNEFYIFYNDDEANDQSFIHGQSNKLSKINRQGLIEWTKEIPLYNYPGFSITSIINNKLNFLYLYNGEFNLMVFDLEGNFLEKKPIIINELYDSVQKSDEGFILTRHHLDGVVLKKYSISGEILETINIDSKIVEPNNTNSILKNDKIYISSASGFVRNSNFSYENYNFKIFSQNNLLNTINFDTPEGNIFYGLNKVFKNGNILITSDKRQGNIELKLFNENSIEIANNNFEKNYIGNLFLNNSENIAIVGNYKESTNSIRTHLTILDSNLNISSQRLLGVNNYNNFRIAYESNNHYYVVGLTDSRTGDFDLPNNSTGTDMFIYKLKK
ncbi:hypothetical protein [Polaribacter sp. Asnod6-C07]|uniref:hypothetical protein n=1 Tax=Polaribacter sp. Asnod6-C07 TaxID=3160582 RepID=UPI00386FBA7D